MISITASNTATTTSTSTTITTTTTTATIPSNTTTNAKTTTKRSWFLWIKTEMNKLLKTSWFLLLLATLLLLLVLLLQLLLLLQPLLNSKKKKGKIVFEKNKRIEEPGQGRPEESRPQAWTRAGQPHSQLLVRDLVTSNEAPGRYSLTQHRLTEQTNEQKFNETNQTKLIIELEFIWISISIDVMMGLTRSNSIDLNEIN